MNNKEMCIVLSKAFIRNNWAWLSKDIYFPKGYNTACEFIEACESEEGVIILGAKVLIAKLIKC